MLIGRDRELGALTDALTAGRPIAVLGEAGAGKTTLVRAAADAAGKRLVEAGGLSTLSWFPYLPLKRAFGRDFAGDVADVASSVQELAAGHVVFFDDLQWADAQTRALVPLLSGGAEVAVAVRRGDAGTSAAMEAAAAAGAELFPLEPLAREDAAALARLLHPELDDRAAHNLAERSGGNPFLLEQLETTGEAGDDLRMAIAARLTGLTPAGRSALATLALLGRPASPRLLGPGAAEIDAAGLAFGHGEISIRHALLAEATVDNLDRAERVEIHSRLAAALDEPGEAARHHAQADEREEALTKALRAADEAPTPGERAAHLALAAANADPGDGDTLRVTAATLLSGIGEHESAEALVVDLDASQPVVRASRALVRSVAHYARNDVVGARAALEETEGFSGDEDLEAALAVQRLELDLHDNLDPQATLERAREAVDLARGHGRREVEALEVLARAKQEMGLDGVPDLRAAMATARGVDDPVLECRIAQALSGMLFNSGQGDAARAVIVDATERAGELRFTSWARRFRARAAWLDLHLGNFRRSADEAGVLLADSLDPWQRFLVTYVAAQASIDLGRHERVSELIDEMARSAIAGQRERQTLWTIADAAFWAGRPREAIEAADEVLARFPHEKSVFARLARAWAHADLDIDPGDSDVDPHAPMLAGAPLELEGVRLLVRGQCDAAARRFSEAAALWAGRQARGELRSLWATGEALRRAGRAAAAAERLLTAEARARAHEHAPLLARAQRSLRLAGVRRSAERTRDGVLTGRESEVLALVGEGLTDAEIAARLGVGAPTVVHLIRSAQQKLGARTRTQAAALATRD